MQISLKWQGFPWRSRKGEEQEKEHAPDYGRYSFRKKEILINGVKGIGAAALLSWFFYHSFWAMLPLSPIVFFSFREMEKELIRKQQQQLADQFKDAILSVAAGLQAGYSIENAFLEAGRDMERLYGADSLMAKEIRYMKKGLRNHLPLEILLQQFLYSSIHPLVCFINLVDFRKAHRNYLRWILHSILPLFKWKLLSICVLFVYYALCITCVLRVYYIQKLRACQNEPSPQKVSIYAVFLELTSLSSFLNGNGNCYCSTNHWVITHTD